MPARPKPKRILAIDWDPRTLRIVHAHLAKRGVKIERVLAVPIPTEVDPANPQQMGGHIRRALEQEGITTRHATVDIPRDQVTLNTLTLPTAVPEGLPGMVQIQIAKELPFSVNDAAIDFAAPAASGAPTADVLVAAVRREVLEQYQATFEAAGLRLDRVGLRPYANKIAVCELLRHAVPDRVVFMDVGPTLTEISLLRGSALAFSRAASVVIPPGTGEAPRLTLVRDVGVSSPVAPSGLSPGEAGPTREGVIQSLVVELTRSIEAYRAKDAGARIDHVVIGGDQGVEEPLAEAIQQRLGTTTEIYNPAACFGWEPDEGAAASAFAATLGLVLGHAREDQLQFDFLHPKRSESAAKKRLKRAPVVAAVVLLFAAAGAVGVAGSTRADRATLARLQARIAELRAQETDNKKFLELVEGRNGLREFDSAQHVWVDVLRDIMQVLPGTEELVLLEIDTDQEGDRVVLKTKSKTRRAAQEAINRLAEFRREGREVPRFKAGMGAQSEKPKEKYPYLQDIRIDILDDAAKATTPGKRTKSS
ncbi:MAG: pilus assembly protein PilM [Planctomycetes bacterium]|nr:pilus assembly protein PilM [Planctomycetota bacterium]